MIRPPLKPTISALDLVARTVFGEARNQSPEGWRAVSWTIKNRLDRPGWWGKTLPDICLKPKQFSCWNPGDPNYQKLLDLPDDDLLLSRIRLVVQEVFEGRAPDPTGGATHYHTIGVNPSWDDAMTETTVIGDHVFFKEG